MGNNYIIDTNVIIADPYFAKSFENCTIYIPIHVLEELDKLKSREGNTGFRARQFFRYFKEIEKEGNLLEGVVIEKNVILKTIIGNFVDRLPDSFDQNYVDNKILALMLTERI